MHAQRDHAAGSVHAALERRKLHCTYTALAVLDGVTNRRLAGTTTDDFTAAIAAEHEQRKPNQPVSPIDAADIRAVLAHIPDRTPTP